MGKLLTLKQCSHPPGANCVVYCDRQANFYLDCSDAVLMLVQTIEGRYHFLWQSLAKRLDIKPAYCPAFQEDFFLAITGIKAVRQIALDEVFCHNGDSYYLAANDVGTMSIRLLSIYPSQRVIEQITAYDNISTPIEQICLQKVYPFGADEHIATIAWAVFRGNVCDHIPVFETNNDAFAELIQGAHIAKTMHCGDSFVWQKKIYTLKTDNDGKLSLLQTAIEKGAANWQMTVSQSQKKVKYCNPAKILSLH